MDDHCARASTDNSQSRIFGDTRRRGGGFQAAVAGLVERSVVSARPSGLFHTWSETRVKTNQMLICRDCQPELSRDVLFPERSRLLRSPSPIDPRGRRRIASACRKNDDSILCAADRCLDAVNTQEPITITGVTFNGTVRVFAGVVRTLENISAAYPDYPLRVTMPD